MIPEDELPSPARSLAGLVAVVLAAIALLVVVGAVAAVVAPDFGGNDIVEAGSDTRDYPHANELLNAIGCTEMQAVAPFGTTGPSIRSYATPTASSCLPDGPLAFVYVDKDDRYTAEDDGDVTDRVCEEVMSSTDDDIVVGADGAEAVATTTVPTSATSTTTVPDVTFGFVRGPNWILATSGGESTALSLQRQVNGVVFTKICRTTDR